jgi:S-adenosylmethionine synthetase
MEGQKRLFTSEHISPGHPDKVADQISDMILDRNYECAVEALGSEQTDEEKVLATVLNTRVAMETLVKSDTVVLAGEVTSTAKLDYGDEIGKTLERIGYTKDISDEFNSEDFKLFELVTGQSPDIDACVSKSSIDEIGAGDQGIMFGYAVNEAPDYTGWCHYIARMIVSEIWEMKRANDTNGLKSICPDFKVQVTIDYAPEVPKLETVLVSCSHTKQTEFKRLKYALKSLVKDALQYFHDRENWNLDLSDYKILINPYGPFTIFGPVADSGLTGRKIVCDQYGGYAPVGGGAFSGKDLTKVDRTAAYMARFVAKNIMNKLVHGYLDSPLDNPYDCSVEVAYIIGQAEPVSVNVTVKDKSGDTWLVPEETLEKVFDRPIYKLFKPVESIRYLHLEQVRYEDVAAFGHIGVDTQHIRKPWEQLI